MLRQEYINIAPGSMLLGVRGLEPGLKEWIGVPLAHERELGSRVVKCRGPVW